jgi:hypothetical protein
MFTSDGIAITAIARPHGNRVAETTATRPGGDQGRAPVGEPGDSRDAGGVGGFWEGHIRGRSVQDRSADSECQEIDAVVNRKNRAISSPWR